MNSEGTSGGATLKTFILENRDLYRLFLRHWLEDRNGYQVVFFDSAEALQNSPEPRRFELMAAHLLPSPMLS